MKKFCLMFVLFAFIAAVPAWSAKVITNIENDRTVPSRCSTWDDGSSVEQDDNYDYADLNTERQPDSGYRHYAIEQFDLVYKPILKNDFRQELIGTTWYYYKIKHDGTNGSDAVKNKPEGKSKTDDNSKQNTKGYTREAADYYALDTLKQKVTPVPSAAPSR